MAEVNEKDKTETEEKNEAKVDNDKGDDTENKDDDVKEKECIKIALIGAGPSGLSVLNAFDTEIKKVSSNIPNFQIVCFEQQENIGGQWNYSWKTESNEYGQPSHSAMYHDLWTNGPKECLEFPDYSFKQHFKTNIGSFPPMKVMKDYILGRVKHKNLLNNAAFNIKFGCKVVNVAEIENGNRFKLKYKDLKNDKCNIDIFDYVIVCSGHFCTPNIVHFKGFDEFNGRILHAHSFRNAKEFKGQNIVVIGASYSAEDIALNCWKFGAKSVTISYRTAPMNFKWPKGVIEVPLLAEITADGKARFVDGTTVENIDAVILCTGYIHHFPFLDDNIRLQTRNILYPNNLYKGCVWLNNPKLFYVGMQDQWYTFTMFDVQAFYVKDVILRNVQIVSKNEMMNDVKKWMEEEKNNTKDDEGKIMFQTNYILDVCKQILTPDDYVDDIKKLDCNKQFFEWEHNRHHDIVTHRDKVHKSNITGIIAEPFHTSWPRAFDDSIQCYLGKKSVNE